MGVMRKIDRPVLYPRRTLWGRSEGPVVYCGDLLDNVRVGNDVLSASVYLDERESREVLHAWGWPTPEDYAEMVELAEQLSGRVAELEAELEEALESQVQVVSLADVLASSASSPTRKTNARKEASG